MPRLSAAQEQHVRDRIIRAAVEVFSEKGYHRATIADVVGRSGLSVGAIYTHFTGKEELFLQSCDLMSGQGLDELAIRLAPLTSTADRLVMAIAYYVETIDEFQGAPGQVGLVRAWAEAGEEPGVREMLARRRERLVGAAQLLLREGVARGELPSWIDVDGLARGFLALLDGLLLQRIEAGDSYRPEESIRRATALLDVLLASAAVERPAVSTA
ncbi:MAG TPA: TetR/AcrR family transcriptional regulator [Candidatus Limnocylindrales bacterium]|nr:TetR/AcrR family transcriptional regulator [Candidatus Limnocylindrales bacterium]